MTYNKSVNYVLSNSSIETESQLRKYAIEILENNSLEITNENIELSIIQLAEHYQKTVICLN